MYSNIYELLTLKKEKLAVVGLGYVGLPIALEFARKISVIGFDIKQDRIELMKKKDYGQYIDKGRNDLVVCFITTNDITGGNSGSPVIDGSGNLIGLAFDGNYEALSHKIAFDKDLNRTINVDVRYVLWCIDKLGGAKNIIDELKLVK